MLFNKQHSQTSCFLVCCCTCFLRHALMCSGGMWAGYCACGKMVGSSIMLIATYVSQGTKPDKPPTPYWDTHTYCPLSNKWQHVHMCCLLPVLAHNCPLSAASARFACCCCCCCCCVSPGISLTPSASLFKAFSPPAPQAPVAPASVMERSLPKAPFFGLAARFMQ